MPPRVRLNVTDTGTPAVTSTTVTRLNPDGRTVPVRTLDGNPLVLTSSTGLLYDYEMPYGAAVSYSTTATPGSSSAQVTVDVDDTWLVHPGVPALSMPVEFMAGSFDEEPQEVEAGVFYPMGRELPVVQTSGTRQGIKSSFIIGTESLQELADLRALVKDAGVLLLNVPATSGLGVDPCYVFISGFTPRRRSDIGTYPARNVTCTYFVVSMPIGGTQAQRTYADLLDFASYNALKAAYPTYTALLAGP